MPFHSVVPAAVTAITRTVTVAAGRFTPGHLGELTAVVPFELVDAVVEETLTVQRHLREKYPAEIKLWSDAWAEMVPFLSFDVEIRKVICARTRLRV